MSLVLAGAVLAAIPGTAPAQAADAGVWHVGPTPAVRAVHHAGDTLWVGTSAGVFRFDVRDGRPIDRVAAGEHLPSPSVRCITARGESVLVGTDDGLAIFRGDRVSVLTPSRPGAAGAAALARIRDITVGADGDVLISTAGFGAGVITASGGYTVTRRDSLLDDVVFGIVETPNGRRYLATRGGLCAQVGDTTFVWYQAGSGLPRGEVTDIARGDGNAIYVLVARLGVYRFDGRAAREVDAPAGLPLHAATAIDVGPDDALWAVGHGWIGVRRGTRWKAIDVNPRDATARWRTVTADGAGAFVGSADGVVVAVERGGALRIELERGLPAPRVASIVADGRGGGWVVAGGKPLRVDATRRVVGDTKPAAGLAADSPADATMLALTPSGDVVAACRWTLRRHADGGWTDLRPDVIDADAVFTAVAADARGYIWAGTRTGDMYRFDGEVWLRIARAPAQHAAPAIASIVPFAGTAWSVESGVPARPLGGRLTGISGIPSDEAVVEVARGPAGQWVAISARTIYTYDGPEDAWVAADPAAIAGANARGSARVAVRGRLSAVAFAADGSLILGSTEGIGIYAPGSTRWIGLADGLGGRDVTDLAVDDRWVWVGFAEDGFSVVPRVSGR